MWNLTEALPTKQREHLVNTPTNLKMQVHEEIANRESRKNIFKKKIFILDFFIKEDVSTR